MKKLIFLLTATILIQGCNKVDDYMLGKDNTPKPAELDKIEPKLSLVNQWTTPVGKAQKKIHFLKLKPLIKDNIIYTADHSGLITAINKTNAKKQWSNNIKAKIVSGPAVYKDVLAVTTESSELITLSRMNGNILWKKKLSSIALAKPAIKRGMIFAKTVDGNLYAFNSKDGGKKWTVNHGSPNLILKAGSSPVVLGDIVLAGYSDGKLDAVNIHNGKLLWQRSIGYPSGASDVEKLVDIDADPIIKNNVAYIASYQGYIGALSLKNGKFLWHKPASIYKNMVLSGNTLYYTDSDDIVWAVNANSGSVKWKQDKLKARNVTEPVIMNKRLIVGDKTGLLHVLSTSTGEFLGREHLASAIDVAPVIENNSLFVQTRNGALSHFELS